MHEFSYTVLQKYQFTEFSPIQYQEVKTTNM